MSTDQDTRASLPSLVRHDVPDTDSPRGLILMLHGGKAASQIAVDDRSLSRKRSLAMHAAIAPAASEARVSTWLLSYRVRGWNGGSGPVADARWALDQVRREVGDVPVALLGHSMGGRTAVHVADDPLVTGVVGLAPWWPTDEPVEALAGKRLVAAHGRRDKITSYRATGRFVQRARGVAASVDMHDMGPVGHYLLRRVGAWNDVALASTLALLV